MTIFKYLLTLWIMFMFLACSSANIKDDSSLSSESIFHTTLHQQRTINIEKKEDNND